MGEKQCLSKLAHTQRATCSPQHDTQSSARAQKEYNPYFVPGSNMTSYVAQAATRTQPAATVFAGRLNRNATGSKFGPSVCLQEKETPIRTTELRIQAVTPHPKFQC